jgi:hypothetical protein
VKANGVSNRHPADELAEVREKIRALQAREAELRDMLMHGNCGLVGDDHVAVIKTMPRTRIDLPALRKHLGAKLKPFMVAREMTQIWIDLRK